MGNKPTMGLFLFKLGRGLFYDKEFKKWKFRKFFFNSINPLASPSAGAPALKYGGVNIVTPSPGEVKGLIQKIIKKVKW